MFKSKGFAFWKELLTAPLLNSEQLLEIDKIFHKFLGFTNICVFGNKKEFLDFFEIPEYRIFDEELTDLVSYFFVKRDEITKLSIYFSQDKNDEDSWKAIEGIYEEFDKNAYRSFIKQKEKNLPLVIHKNAQEMFALLLERLPANLERVFGRGIVEYFEIQLKPIKKTNVALDKWKTIAVFTKKFFETNLNLSEENSLLSINNALERLDEIDDKMNFSIYFLNSFDDHIIESFFALMDQMRQRYGRFTSLLFHSLVSKDEMLKHTPRLLNSEMFEEYFEVVYLPLEYKLSILRDFVALNLYQRVITDEYKNFIELFKDTLNCINEAIDGVMFSNNFLELDEKITNVLAKIESANIRLTVEPSLRSSLSKFVFLNNFLEAVELLDLCISDSESIHDEKEITFKNHIEYPNLEAENRELQMAIDIFKMCAYVVEATNCFTIDDFHKYVINFLSELLIMQKNMKGESDISLFVEKEKLRGYKKAFQANVKNAIYVFLPKKLKIYRQEIARFILKEQIYKIIDFLKKEIANSKQEMILILKSAKEEIFDLKRNLFKPEKTEILIETITKILEKLL